MQRENIYMMITRLKIKNKTETINLHVLFCCSPIFKLYLVCTACLFMCLKSKISLSLPLPLTATVNGFTTCGALDTSRTRPSEINSKIAFSTKMVCAYADLLLFTNTNFGSCNKGIL